MRHLSSVAVALILSTASVVPARPADRIAPPFDPGAARLLSGRQIAFGACPEPPPPVVDMSGLQSRYDPKDPTQSRVDPERDKRDKERSAANEKLVMEVDRLADRFAISQPPNPQISACIMRKIAVWARANALTQGIEQNDRLGRHQAVMTQAWYGAGLASALVRIGGFEAAPGADADAIRPWMQRMAVTVKAEYAFPASWTIPNNNHKYWSGYFVGIAAVLFNDSDFFKFSRKMLEEALDDVGADGSIAKEMGRGARSQSYQLFATLPIVALTVLSEKNGAPLSARQHQMLDRLITFNLDALARPEIVEAKTKVKQELANRSFDFAWADMILPSLKLRNPELATRLEAVVAAPRMRPAWHIFLGGDVTSAYNPTALLRAPLPQ